MYANTVQILEVSDESPQEGGKRILLDSGGSETDVNGRPYSEWALVNEGNGRPRRVCLGLRRLHDPKYGGVTPVPMGNRHYPIPAYSLAEQVEKQVRTLYGEHNGYVHRGHHITVSKDGNKVFGLITMESPGLDGKGWAVGWRGSVDQSLSVLFAVGVNLWMCENLCLSGDATRIMRKSTANALRDIEAGVLSMIYNADSLVGNMLDDLDAFKSARLDQTRMAELVGRAQYHGVIKPTQANRIYKEIHKPTHAYTPEGDTVYDCFNHFTYACKQGGGDRMFQQHGNIHKFHKDYVLELSPTQIQVPLGLPSPLDVSSIHIVDPDEDYNAF